MAALQVSLGYWQRQLVVAFRFFLFLNTFILLLLWRIIFIFFFFFFFLHLFNFCSPMFRRVRFCPANDVKTRCSRHSPCCGCALWDYFLFTTISDDTGSDAKQTGSSPYFDSAPQILIFLWYFGDQRHTDYDLIRWLWSVRSEDSESVVSSSFSISVIFWFTMKMPLNSVDRSIWEL